MILAAVVWLIAGGPVIILADVPPLVVAAAIAGIVAVIGAVLTFITQRANAKATKLQVENAERLGLINAGQDVLKDAVDTLRAENLRQTARIIELEQIVRAMRAELAEALKHSLECEETLSALREQLGGASGTV